MMTHLRRNYCYTLLSLLAVCLSFTACVPEGIELPSRVKSIATDVATSVTSNGAKLCGVVSVYDTDTISCGIIYDTSSTLSSDSGKLRSTSANGKYSVPIGGLKANTTYYYRAYALDAGVYKYGEVLSFTTLQNVIISTGEATDVTTNGATLSGTVSGTEEAISCGFIYGTTSDMSSQNNHRAEASSNGTYSVSISNLQANTTYYYCAYVIIDGEEKLGEVLSFTTEQEVVEPEPSSPEAIDLGLSVKWASFNVGANSPEDYGDYFAWGETSTKSEYNESNSVTYGLSILELKSRGIIGDDGNLTAEYDAATANWGEGWRMPTFDEIRELINNCNREWTNMNGVDGYKVTSSNGSSIFLPAAGYRSDTWLGDAGSNGHYRSATPDSDSRLAYDLYFRSGHCYWYHMYSRGKGFSVRPVYSEVSLRVVAIETGEATDITTNGATLNGAVSGADEAINCGFIYGTSSDMSSANNNREEASSNGTYSVSISNLQANTNYYYCAYAIIDGEETLGEVLSFTTEQEVVEPEAIDLGLSVKWASFNVGANSPEDYGYYFAWGETSKKSEYTVSNSVTYGLSISELESRGIIDAGGNLTAAYDAATANWGEGWRMPALAEIQELIDNCTWKWTTNDGTYGYEVTGPNGNSIFLPAAGIRSETSIYGEGTGGYYWSVMSVNGDRYYARRLSFSSDTCDYKISGRHSGQVVRPVYSETPLRVVTIETSKATDITSEGAILNGVISGADKPINCGFIYGTSSDMSSLNNNRAEASSNGTYSVSISHLQANTTYYYCAYAIIGGEEQYGEVLSFTTSELPASSKTYTVNGVSFTMIGVEGGTFTMGSPDSDSDAENNEKPAHQVTLGSFYIGETEVTQELWQAVMGDNPCFKVDMQCPVETVSWNDCQTFISKLNELTGESFRLPTEAEWEYAARGGNKSKGYKYSGSNTLGDVAWHTYNSSRETHAVKTKQPNELGIYDMSGNVWEWCSDWYGSYSSSAQSNPTGPSSGSNRVLRGGSWLDSTWLCRVAYRNNNSPDGFIDNWGFRLSLQFIP